MSNLVKEDLNLYTGTYEVNNTTYRGQLFILATDGEKARKMIARALRKQVLPGLSNEEIQDEIDCGRLFVSELEQIDINPRVFICRDHV